MTLLLVLLLLVVKVWGLDLERRGVERFFWLLLRFFWSLWLLILLPFPPLLLPSLQKRKKRVTKSSRCTRIRKRKGGAFVRYFYEGIAKVCVWFWGRGENDEMVIIDNNDNNKKHPTTHNNKNNHDHDHNPTTTTTTTYLPHNQFENELHKDDYSLRPLSFPFPLVPPRAPLSLSSNHFSPEKRRGG